MLSIEKIFLTSTISRYYIGSVNYQADPACRVVCPIKQPLTVRDG